MNASGKARRKPQGRQPLHGAWALERRLRENALDQRTTTARMLREIEESLASDAGGTEALSSRERVLIRRCAAQVLILESIERWTFNQPSVLTDAAELLPILRRGYIAHLNSLRLGLLALGLRPERPDMTPSFVPEIVWPPNRTPGSAGGAQSDGRTRDKAKPVPSDDDGSEVA